MDRQEVTGAVPAAPARLEGLAGGAPLLELTGLTKRFADVTVLRGVDLTIRAGSIHALLGANGAGKSTLVKHLSGYYEPTDCGPARMRGADLAWPVNQRRDGVLVMHQDLALVDDLSILDNIVVARTTGRGTVGPRRPHDERRRCISVLRSAGLEVNPQTLVGQLTLGERALVALARLLDEMRNLPAESQSHPILILDEPTAALPAAEARRMLQRLQDLAAAGAAVLLVTHRLQEVRSCATEISVLREGRRVFSGPVPETDQEIETLMFGEDPGPSPGRKARPGDRSAQGRPTQEKPGQAPVRFFGSTGNGEDRQLFECAPGEVLGITGLAGVGVETTPYRVVGVGHDPIAIELDGRRRRLTPRAAAVAGVRLVPGNRAAQAIWLQGTVRENYAIAGQAVGFSLARIRRRKERARTLDAIKSVGVSPPNIDMPLAKFSGGNQQKVVVSRYLADPKLKLLLVHEPTQGIDLQTRRTIVAALRQLARRSQVPVVIFSMDCEVLAHAADRVIVMHHDVAVSELAGSFDDKAIETAIFLSGGTPHTSHSGGTDARHE